MTRSMKTSAERLNAKVQAEVGEKRNRRNRLIAFALLAIAGIAILLLFALVITKKEIFYVSSTDRGDEQIYASSNCNAPPTATPTAIPRCEEDLQITDTPTTTPTPMCGQYTQTPTITTTPCTPGTPTKTVSTPTRVAPTSTPRKTDTPVPTETETPQATQTYVPTDAKTATPGTTYVPTPEETQPSSTVEPGCFQWMCHLTGNAGSKDYCCDSQGCVDAHIKHGDAQGRCN